MLIALITDRRRYAADESLACDGLVRTAGRAARAGVDLIHVRERGLADRGLLLLVRRVIEATQGTGARVLLNDRTDVALAAGAAGVHLPAAAPAASRIRAIVPALFLIGRSVHDVEEASAAEQDGGCDYLLFGTVFESGSKPPGHQAAGTTALQRVCASVGLPVLGVGGVTLANAGELARAGASGVAAIELFARAAQPRADSTDGLRDVVSGLRRAFEKRDW